jgi:hypothetical protein
MPLSVATCCVLLASDACFPGISQRDYSCCWPFLKGMRADIRSRILSFFSGKIRDRFALPNCMLPDRHSDVADLFASDVFDVFLDKKRVWLVDFAPFGGHTQVRVVSDIIAKLMGSF